MTSKTALAASAAPRALFHAPMGALMNRGAQVAYAPDDGQGALSVADAVAALREPEVEPAVEEAPEGEPAAEPEAEEAPEPESEPEPTGEEPPDPAEEPAIEGEVETAEPESDPAAKPVIAAPASWDAAERATFATLPPKAQEIILNRETDRDRAVTKAIRESSEVRKTAEADLAGLAQYKATFDQIAERANTVFADKWANVDWTALARSDPNTYIIAKAEHDAEAAELQKVQSAQAAAEQVRQQAERVQFKSYVTEELAELSQVAPEMADPKTGPAIRSEVTQFLQGLRRSDGQRAIPDENIERISAVEMALARDAMELRKLKATGKTVAARPPAPATRPAPAPARAAAPSAAPPARPPRQRDLETAMSRLSQKGSVENAMAALQASRK